MNQSIHRDSKKQNKDVIKKDEIISMIEQQITEKFKTMYKDQEQIQENLYKGKQDQMKDDQTANQILNKFKEWAQDTTFKKFSTQVSACQKIPQEEQAKYAKLLNDMNALVIQIDQDRSKVKIKLNVYYQRLLKSTNTNLQTSQQQLVLLNQAGFCGKGEALRGFQVEYRKLEFDIIQWQALPQLDNNNVELYIIRPQMNFDQLKQYTMKLLVDYFPEANGETKIIEKIVEVPKVVEKIIEKPVDRIVEKIVEKRVEIKVPEYREVEVPKVSDKIREAHEMLYGIGRPQNVTEALSLYYEEAEVNNNVLAINAIAQIFYEGKFFPKDLNKAYSYWERSAALSNPEGYYRIGRLMMDKQIDGVALSGGRLRSRDDELNEALVYFSNASEQGHLDALVDLGEIYENGLKSEDQVNTFLQEPQLEQAEFYFQQGKKIRYPRAINGLGLFYLNHPNYQETVAGNNARKAIKYFEMARELGFAKSLYWLAFCYENGQGVMPNLELAKSYYKEGALRGDSDCKVHYMHFIIQDASNSGRQEDYIFCHTYLIQVMNSNPEITEVYFYLGHLYECGFGVTKDPTNAIHYYFKGSKLGNPACKTKLGDCYHSGFGVPQNQKEALKYYREAAQLKDTEALINMGVIYESGYEGVPIDFAKAFECYEEAAQFQNPKAEFHLGLMYETGRYVKKDMNFAIERYKKAAIMGCQEARDMLQKKQIPILYDDGVHSTNVDVEDQQNAVVLDRTSMMATQQLPLITNPLIVHQGKKTNVSIIATKQAKAETGEGRMVSVLSQHIGNQVQSQIQRYQ